MVAFTNDSATIRRLLSAVERMIAEISERQRIELSRLEGQRDRLMAQLLDSEGLHDRRPAGLR